MSRPDLDELLNALFPFAQQMLQKRGAFYPFGASMGIDGQVVSVAGYSGTEHPEAQEMIDFLTVSLRQEAASGQIKAAGICIDARTIPPGQTEKTDAILARLEHRDGEAIEVLLPYRKGLLGKVKYGEIFATAGTPRVFAGGAA